jgi:hypothetical protein
LVIEAAELLVRQAKRAAFRGEGTQAQVAEAERAEYHARQALERAAAAVLAYVRGPGFDGSRDSVAVPPELLAEPRRRVAEAKAEAQAAAEAYRRAQVAEAEAERVVRWVTTLANGLGDQRPWAWVAAWLAVEKAAGAVLDYLRGPEWNGGRESVVLPASVLAEPLRREAEARAHAAELRAAAREADTQAERASRLVRWLYAQATGLGACVPWADVADEPAAPEPAELADVARAMMGQPPGETAPPVQGAPSERGEEYREAGNASRARCRSRSRAS